MAKKTQECDIEKSFLDLNNGQIYEVCNDNTNDNIDDNVSKNDYLQVVYLSQNVVTEEVHKIVEKIKRSEYYLFQYYIVNLSE
uniref:Uncharacterized protein n=1 Tax=Rhizophagus irregularis (strain DAOM 181602 / DAOM 197198 / MUCL 43194) TaxID=747089 RepID=U9TNG1_RHIID